MMVLLHRSLLYIVTIIAFNNFHALSIFGIDIFHDKSAVCVLIFLQKMSMAPKSKAIMN